MKGDYSRLTFTAGKHYNGVLQQQGRVQVDADWNEQQAINRHRAETDTCDVVGPSGAPKTSPGFEIGVTPDGQDLRIGAGRYYLDGVLCENEADVAFTAQPDRRPHGGSLLPTADGLYLAYLQVWDRHVTALEDRHIRETALGGPDTATRTKTVWQVRLLGVADPGVAVSCATDFPEWTEVLRRNLVGVSDAGRLAARSEAVAPSPDPLCVLPPSAGYRGFENQLYRVEVHRGGDRDEASFKWSRDNGTVASAIEPDDNGVVVSGSVIEVAEIGKDGMLTFASDPLPEWLELTDDRYDLESQHGSLARVQAVDPSARRITFAPGALPALEATEHPLVRRWDQRGGDAGDQGVAMTGEWQHLENGVEVRFDDGVYRDGDFWLIPARTANGLDTGSVEWPDDGGNPVPQTPHGTPHRFARLALVRREGGVFALVPGSDCRELFSPLTSVQQALDDLGQHSVYSLVVGPGESLAVAIAGLAGPDALIGLAVGTYQLDETVRIENRGHIQIAGAGPGTRVVAATSETALHFANCASVKVSNLHVEGGTATGEAASGINGALTFVDCPVVTVEDASLACAGGPPDMSSCITIRGFTDNRALSSQAYVRRCDFRVGHLQTGVLITGAFRADVTDNNMRPGARPSDDDLLQDPDYRALLRPHLLRRVIPEAHPDDLEAVWHNSMGVTVTSRIPGSLWQRAIDSVNPPGIRTSRMLRAYLFRLASDLIRTRGTGPGGSQPFRDLVSRLLRDDKAAIGQAIAVGGASVHVQVTGNTMFGAVRGILAGWGLAGTVLIADNAVVTSQGPSATRERYGICVGPADSLVIERNRLGMPQPGGGFGEFSYGGPMEGIRVFGSMGSRAIVRHNHMGPYLAVGGPRISFSPGITFAPLNLPLPAQPLWIITENVMESAAVKVDVPAKGPGKPGVTDPAAVRQLVRGINDNFA